MKKKTYLKKIIRNYNKFIENTASFVQYFDTYSDIIERFSQKLMVHNFGFIEFRR